MSVLSVAPTRGVLVDLIARPSSRTHAFALDAGLVLAGVAVVALLAKVSFFIGPVPITGQTLGVILVGAALGARRGAASLAAYAAVGLAGLPVFAGVAAGPLYVLAPSFGFVIGFIPAAFVAGWVAERMWDRQPALAFAGFVGASIIPFLTGVPYMAVVLSLAAGSVVSLAEIMGVGVIPFIAPGLFKAGVAALLIPLAWTGVKALEHRKER